MGFREFTMGESEAIVEKKSFVYTIITSSPWQKGLTMHE